MDDWIGDFDSSIFSGLFYLDPKTREKILLARNALVDPLTTGEVTEVRGLMEFVTKASSSLITGIEIDYT